MSTECLYYQNAYIRSFDAVVKSCKMQGERYAVVLDKTAFFPEGGGQLADLGTLNGKRILDVQLCDGEVVHFCETGFAAGEKVFGEIDWENRFSLMQQHSGEHLLSGIIHRRYGFDNIGFHMSARSICVDFNGVIPAEDILLIELEVNKAVWSNIESEIIYPDENELVTIDYRSKKTIEGQVRIVRFSEIDVCACCGTHVHRTGEIGAFKILNISKAHGGTRLEVVCGKQALDFLQRINEQNNSIGKLLSAKPLETAEAVQRLLEDRNEVLRKLNLIEKQQFELIAKSMKGKVNCLLFEDDLSSDGVRDLVIAVMRYCSGICAAFSGNDETGYKYAIGSQSIDLRELVKKMNSTLCGRGGGKPFFAQGTVNKQKSEIDTFFIANGFEP